MWWRRFPLLLKIDGQPGVVIRAEDEEGVFYLAVRGPNGERNVQSTGSRAAYAAPPAASETSGLAISQPPPHGEAQQSTGSRAQQHEPAVSMESAKYLGCATRLQAAKLRLILCFMHNDRLTENCEVELVGGRVPETIAAFLKM